MPLTYEEVAEFPHPWQVVFDAVQRALPRLRRHVLQWADAPTGRILAMKENSFLAYDGARFVIDVGHVSSHVTRVRVWSHLQWFVDTFGRNKRNVKRILSAIGQELGENTQWPRR
jgi:hypothetical protein